MLSVTMVTYKHYQSPWLHTQHYQLPWLHTNASTIMVTYICISYHGYIQTLSVTMVTYTYYQLPWLLSHKHYTVTMVTYTHYQLPWLLTNTIVTWLHTHTISYHGYIHHNELSWLHTQTLSVTMVTHKHYQLPWLHTNTISCHRCIKSLSVTMVT